MTSINNCVFRFECPKTWNKLLETSNKKIRYCTVCDKGVHLCETDAELKKALEKNWCVAVDKDIKEVPTRLIGDVEPEHFVKDL